MLTLTTAPSIAPGSTRSLRPASSSTAWAFARSIVKLKVISQAIDSVKIGVQEGKGIAQSMKATGLFPPIVVQMVSVGEETGKVDELLLHVANYYDTQVSFMVDNLTTLIEPMLLLVLGGGVLTMALGIFLPMWNLMSIFRK